MSKRVRGRLLRSAAARWKVHQPFSGLNHLVVLSLVISSCAACAGSPSPKPPLRETIIAATTLPGSASVYVAHQKGFFRDEGLDADVLRYGAGRLALDAVLGGKADFALVADTPIVGAVLDGKRPVVVATVAEIDSAQVIVARRDRGISGARDLIGKRVGVLPGTSADFFLHIYLVTSGISRTQVNVMPLKADEIVAALTEGRVDAVSVYAPYSMQAEKRLGADALVLDQPGLYTTFWNAAVRSDFASSDRDIIVGFLHAVARANDFIDSNPAEAQAITADHTGIATRDLTRDWSKNHWTLELTQPLILTLEDEYRWMSGDSTTPNFLSNIDVAPLTVVRPDGVTLIEPKD